MPLPTPNSGESKEKFLSRCMGDETMVAEYDGEKQRYAVCQSQWANREAPAQIERRVMPLGSVGLRVERRDDGTPRTISGYAAVFDKWSVDLGGFREKIAPGAFKNAIGKSDVRALVNHDTNMLLGRTDSGTLRIAEDTRGLHFVVELPNTQTARDTADLIERGDINGCSFSFSTTTDEWTHTDDGKEERTLIEVNQLYDLGPVAFPAYPDTTVAARSLEAFRKIQHDGEDARGEAMEQTTQLYVPSRIEQARAAVAEAKMNLRKKAMEALMDEARASWK